MKLVPMLVMAYVILVSCGNSKSEEDIAKNEVEQFAEAYFNYDLKTALEHCTTESRRWIEYTASNISNEDIDILRTKQDKAETSIEEIAIDDNDSTGTALVNVRNYLCLDTIGKAGAIAGNTSVDLYIVKRKGRWMVDIRKAFPLRSGKRGRD